MVPSVVAQEAEHHRPGWQGRAPATLRLVDPDPARVRQLLAETRLDPGEAAALALWERRRDAVLLCDDLAARRHAEAAGCPMVGTLGLLLAAAAFAGGAAVAGVATAIQTKFSPYRKLDVFTRALSYIENNYVEEVDQERQVAYFFLGSLLGYETADAVAKMALLDFQSYVGRRYLERRSDPVSLFVDELGDVLTPEFVNILNKARGAGVSVTACAQTVSDLEAALGSRARALQVVGNVNTVVQFRAASASDAEAFGELAGRRLLRLPSEGEFYAPAFFGTRDIDDFRAAFSWQLQPVEMPLVPSGPLQELPTFHFFARWGARVYRGCVPLVDHEISADLDDADGDGHRRGEDSIRIA
jgi:hypothetical protein